MTIDEFLNVPKATHRICYASVLRARHGDLDEITTEAAKLLGTPQGAPTDPIVYELCERYLGFWNQEAERRRRPGWRFGGLFGFSYVAMNDGDAERLLDLFNVVRNNRSVKRSLLGKREFEDAMEGEPE